MQDWESVAAAIDAGELVPHTRIAGWSADQVTQFRDQLLTTSNGRRWLRSDHDLDVQLADRLLEVEDDFRQRRRDRTLATVAERASIEAVERHAAALAAGPAAQALWHRLAGDHSRFVRLATILASSDDRQAAEATLHLLVLDPLDPVGLGTVVRGQISIGALESIHADVRGLAVEFLAENDPAAVERVLAMLMFDDSQRVRGVAWSAALRANRRATIEQAVDLLSDESAPVAVRRSALVALGTQLPTRQMVDLLTYFVVHPNHDLAADAADLLYQQHRNPITAEAARDSPHADVREVAERLLDPLRGSPAAGGSRPGDPTRSSTDIFADMIRQLEERADNQNDTNER